MSTESKTIKVESKVVEVDLTTLLKLIPEFDTVKTSDVYRFVRSCDAAFKLASTVQETILLTYALNKITGPGSSDVHAKSFLTWFDLRGFIIQKYSQTKTLGHLQLELQSLFQNPNESITEYFHRVDLCRSKLIEKLTAEINDETLQGRVATTEETALNVFVNGLSSDIGIMLRVRSISNLTDAGNFAIQEEKIRNMNNVRHALYKHNASTLTRSYSNPQAPNKVSDSVPPRTFQNAKTCNYCKKPGHLISECRKRAYNNGNRPILVPAQQQQRAAPVQAPVKVNNLNYQAAEEMGTTSGTATNYYSSAQTPTLNLSPSQTTSTYIKTEASQLE